MAKLRRDGGNKLRSRKWTYRREGTSVQRTPGGVLPGFRQDEREQKRVSGLIERGAREERRDHMQDGVVGPRKRAVPRPPRGLFRPEARLDASQVKDMREAPTRSTQRRRPGKRPPPRPPSAQRRRPKVDPYDPSLPVRRRN